jgi:hypothetical protein
VPSASATSLLFVVACLAVGGAVAGCTSSQQTAARLRLNSARLIESRKVVSVDRIDRSVRVLRTSLVHGKNGTAAVVVLRNRGKANVNDLPLEVGVRSGGHPTYLNARRHLPYFQAHAPALAPGGQTTWVFTSPHPVAGSSAFARVGVAKSPPTVAKQLPSLDVTIAPPKHGSPARASVHNDSSIPQYSVAVYAAGKRGGRTVTAGRASIAKLDPGETTTVKLPLIGNPKGASLHAYAAPTVFD